MSFFTITNLFEVVPLLACGRVSPLCPSPSQISSPVFPPQLPTCFTTTVEVKQKSGMRRMVLRSLDLGWCHSDNFSSFSFFTWANTAITDGVLNDSCHPRFIGLRAKAAEFIRNAREYKQSFQICPCSQIYLVQFSPLKSSSYSLVR